MTKPKYKPFPLFELTKEECVVLVEARGVLGDPGYGWSFTFLCNVLKSLERKYLYNIKKELVSYPEDFILVHKARAAVEIRAKIDKSLDGKVSLAIYTRRPCTTQLRVDWIDALLKHNNYTPSK